MKVLVACEFSGIVRDAFLERGHFAMSCDYLPTESPRGRYGRFVCGDGKSHDGVLTHYQGSVETILFEEDDLFPQWDLIIAHPPCTRMANSGVRWLHERNLWEEMKTYTDFFRMFLEYPCEMVAVENPIPHKYAINEIGRTYDQKIQPYQFGHPESKATCLWLKGLPKLEPTNIVEPVNQRVWKMGPSKDRSKERSRFYKGIADAMAEQWGK